MINVEMLKRILIFLVAVVPFGCSEEPEYTSRSNKSDQAEEIIESESNGETTEISRSGESNIVANHGRLEFNTFLLLEENQPSSLFRFAEVTTIEPITKIQSRVFIDKTIFSGAMVHVGIELMYQRTDYGNMANLTSVKNQLSYIEEGFRISSTAIGCKNPDCSSFFESSIKEDDKYPVNQIIDVEVGHILSLEWDDKNFGFIFGFDKARGFLSMDDFIHESYFDIADFQHARLFVIIKKTKSTKEGSRVIARFGNVYVNDELYDDFEGDSLNTEKWKSGEIYR